jgi:hypothetical protein
MSVEYPYATGDRLEKRNSYAYTRYQGRPFLDAWRRSRQAVLEALPTPAPLDAQASATATATESSTARRLAGLRADLLQGHRYADLDLLVRHFEVSKRIFGRYTDAWRPEHRDDYHDLSLYLQFSELVALAHEETGRLPYLNALLKCVDTLVALRERLTEAEQAGLAQLILAERAHVDRLEAPS